MIDNYVSYGKDYEFLIRMQRYKMVWSLKLYLDALQFQYSNKIPDDIENQYRCFVKWSYSRNVA